MLIYRNHIVLVRLKNSQWIGSYWELHTKGIPKTNSIFFVKYWLTSDERSWLGKLGCSVMVKSISNQGHSIRYYHTHCSDSVMKAPHCSCYCWDSKSSIDMAECSHYFSVAVAYMILYFHYRIFLVKERGLFLEVQGDYFLLSFGCCICGFCDQH